MRCKRCISIPTSTFEKKNYGSVNNKILNYNLYLWLWANLLFQAIWSSEFAKSCFINERDGAARDASSSFRGLVQKSEYERPARPNPVASPYKLFWETYAYIPVSLKRGVQLTSSLLSWMTPSLLLYVKEKSKHVKTLSWHVLRRGVLRIF